MRQIVMIFSFFFLINSAVFAQFDQGTCKEILSGYSKENASFAKMTIATLDFTEHKQKFDINWLKGFKFNFMEKVLDVEYKTDAGVFHIYVAYDKIIKINTSKTALDIIIQN